MSPPGRENPTLELKVISAKNVSHGLHAKMEVYAVVSITGDNTQRKQVSKTPIDYTGGSNPTWNHNVMFSVNEKAAGEGQLTLTIKLFSHWLEEENDLYLGEVNVWVHELLGSTNENNNIWKSATYPIEIINGIKGTLSLSYWFKPVPVNAQDYLNPVLTRSGQSIIYSPQFETTKRKLTLELVIKFAKNIKNVNIFNEMKVYASVMIREDNKLTKSKIKTPTVYTAYKSPTWNHAVTFSVEEKLVKEGRLNLVVALTSVRPFLGDIEIGVVKVSIKELFWLSPPSHPLVNGIGDDSGMILVTENVVGSYGKRGTLSFTYRFKVKEEPVAQPVIMYVPVSQESLDHGMLGYIAAQPGFQSGPSNGLQGIYMQPQSHEYRPY